VEVEGHVVAAAAEPDGVGEAGAIDDAEEVAGEGVAGLIGGEGFVRDGGAAGGEVKGRGGSLAAVLLVVTEVDAGFEEVFAAGEADGVENAPAVVGAEADVLEAGGFEADEGSAAPVDIGVAEGGEALDAEFFGPVAIGFEDALGIAATVEGEGEVVEDGGETVQSQAPRANQPSSGRRRVLARGPP